MLRLVARYDARVRLFTLTQAAASIGAAEDNDFVLPFPGVSRHHARMERVDHGALLVDLGSKNGLVVHGQRLAQVLLRPGEEVRLGRARMTLEDISSADAELGLALAEALTAAGLPATTSTFLLSAHGGSAAAALRFIRETGLEPLVPGEDARLDTAREALGAETLLLFHPADGDLALVDCRGPIPPAAVLPALAHAGLDPGATTLSDQESGRSLVVAEGSGSLRLAAVFAPETAVAPWQQDFLSYLAARLAPERAPAEPARPQPRLELPPHMVLGEAPASRTLLREIEAAARSRLDVLLLGETGTGKELTARAIHLSGPDGRGPFVAVNCAAIPAELAEAELFGVQKRVATGVDPRPGLFAQARGGTLFLDEVGELPPVIQAKLLRVLEEREIHPLGAAAPKKIDLRVISASNRDLAAAAAQGGFRLDLYYRLRRLEIRLPALRDRREDLPRLIAAFTGRAAAREGKRILGVSRRALDILLEHPWPGNIRELKSVIDRAVLHCLDGGIVESNLLALDGLPPVATDERIVLAAEPPRPSPQAPATLKEQVDAVESKAIASALSACGGNKTKAAQILGLTRNGLSLKMKRLKLAGE